ncbi:hypothetical protein CPB86DRAFT_799062 [Serendipita vermifera]|nr:hypothetical protein CPB86DRAFT_799062 [Serendipita vermifera]
MSRQILSYEDLGPITSVTVPIQTTTSSHEPPRKRARIDSETNSTVQWSANQGAKNHPHSHSKGNQNGVIPGSPKRKGKKAPRPGNPSGVPWTRHWDAQTSSNGNEMISLAYAEEASVSSPPERGSKEQPSAQRTTQSITESVDAIPTSSKTRIQEITAQTIVPRGIQASTSSNLPNPTKTKNAVAGKKKGKNQTSSNAPSKGDSLPLGENEWDDSALIDAWNAAEREYMEMNGGKKWRHEPVNHSSLWHDALESDADSATNDDGDADQEAEVSSSQVALEETEVEGGTGDILAMSISANQPSEHDLKAALDASVSLLGATSSSVLMTEAFNKVKEASYALGYWTAVYQLHAAATTNILKRFL